MFPSGDVILFVGCVHLNDDGSCRASTRADFKRLKRFLPGAAEVPDVQGRAQPPPQPPPVIITSQQAPGCAPSASAPNQPPSYSAVQPGPGAAPAVAHSPGAGSQVLAQRAHAAGSAQALITPHAIGISPAQTSTLSSVQSCSTTQNSVAKQLQGHKLQAGQAHGSPSTPAGQAQTSHSSSCATAATSSSVGYKPPSSILASPQLPAALDGSLGGVAPERPPGLETLDEAGAPEDHGEEQVPQKAVDSWDAQRLVAAGTSPATVHLASSTEQSRAGFAGIPGAPGAHAAAQLHAAAAHAGTQRWGATQQVQQQPQQAAWLQQPPFAAFATPLLRLPESPGASGWSAAHAQTSLFAASYLDMPAAHAMPNAASASTASWLGAGDSATSNWAAAERQRQAQWQLQQQGLQAPILAFPGTQQQGLAARASMLPQQLVGAQVTHHLPGAGLAPSGQAACSAQYLMLDQSHIRQPMDSPRMFSSLDSSRVTTPGSAHSLPATAWAGTADRLAAAESGRWVQGHTPLSDTASQRPAALETRSLLGRRRLDYGSSKAEDSPCSPEEAMGKSADEAKGTATQQAQQERALCMEEHGLSEELGRASSLGSLQTVDEEPLEPQLAARAGEPDLALAGKADASHVRRRGGRGRAHGARARVHTSSTMPAEGAGGGAAAGADSPARLNRPSGPMKLADVILPALEARAKEHQQHAPAPSDKEPEQAGAAQHPDQPMETTQQREEPQSPPPPGTKEQLQGATLKPALCGGRTFAEIVGRDQPGKDQAPAPARSAPPQPPAVANPGEEAPVGL